MYWCSREIDRINRPASISSLKSVFFFPAVTEMCSFSPFLTPSKKNELRQRKEQNAADNRRRRNGKERRNGTLDATQREGSRKKERKESKRRKSADFVVKKMSIEK